jgi:hypothetical protein
MHDRRIPPSSTYNLNSRGLFFSQHHTLGVLINI